jgi:hypothetical protein
MKNQTGITEELSRNELSEEIKEVPKEKRKEILEKAKEAPSYWQARGEKIKKQQEQMEIDGGLGILIKHKILYHGSPNSNIDLFKKAEVHTMGEGVYLTDEANKAIGYGQLRTKEKYSGEINPTIYEAEISNIKLLDLSKEENIKKIALELEKIFTQKLSTVENKTQEDKLFAYTLKQAIDMIKSGEYGESRFEPVARYPRFLSKIFEEYVESLGYDGVFGVEQEGPVQPHTSYVIFNPSKIRIIKENIVRQ